MSASTKQLADRLCGDAVLAFALSQCGGERDRAFLLGYFSALLGNGGKGTTQAAPLYILRGLETSARNARRMVPCELAKVLKCGGFCGEAVDENLRAQMLHTLLYTRLSQLDRLRRLSSSLSAQTDDDASKGVVTSGKTGKVLKRTLSSFDPYRPDGDRKKQENNVEMPRRMPPSPVVVMKHALEAQSGGSRARKRRNSGGTVLSSFDPLFQPRACRRDAKHVPNPGNNLALQVDLKAHESMMYRGLSHEAAPSVLTPAIMPRTCSFSRKDGSA